jgi:hypothetical protein
VTVTGAFRIWLEHPPAGSAVQTEANRVPWYANSNPDHQVELHPVTQIGSLDFLGHVKRIRRGTQTFTGFGPPQLTTVIKKKLTVQRRQVGGSPSFAWWALRRGTTTGTSAGASWGTGIAC